MNADSSKLIRHMNILKRDVFQVENKWPQFDLLLNDMLEMSSTISNNSVVVSFERTLLYGGYSLVAPFFESQNFISLDCSPDSADERGAYNSPMVSDPDFIKIRYNRRSAIDDINLENNLADFVLVPNLIHHVKDQDKLFSEMLRILKPGGRIYIFEAILRELHQIPDDYIRYTPYGLKAFLEKLGMKIEKIETTGGPFSAIGYCWVQALQYFPEDLRSEMSDWFYNKHYQELMSWEAMYKNNLVRNHTAFPVAFSLIAQKGFCDVG